jgi:hypothetical protein
VPRTAWPSMAIEDYRNTLANPPSLPIRISLAPVRPIAKATADLRVSVVLIGRCGAV